MRSLRPRRGTPPKFQVYERISCLPRRYCSDCREEGGFVDADIIVHRKRWKVRYFTNHVRHGLMYDIEYRHKVCFKTRIGDISQRLSLKRNVPSLTSLAAGTLLNNGKLSSSSNILKIAHRYLTLDDKVMVFYVPADYMDYTNPDSDGDINYHPYDSSDGIEADVNTNYKVYNRTVPIGSSKLNSSDYFTEDGIFHTARPLATLYYNNEELVGRRML